MAIHTADRPAQVPSNNNEFWTPLKRGVAIGAAAVSLLGIGGKVGYDAIASPKPVETTQDTDIPVSSYDPADIDHSGSISDIERIQADGVITKDELNSLADPTQTELLDPSDLVTVYTDDFDGWRQETRNILDKKGWLNAEQKAALEEMPTVSIPKENWSNQAVMNAISLDIADASIQEPSELGILMLPTVLDPSAPKFNTIRDNIGERTALDIYKASEAYAVDGGKFMEKEDLSPNARVIIADLIINESYEQENADTTRVAILVDLIAGDDGKESWAKITAWSANNPTVQGALEKLSAA